MSASFEILFHPMSPSILLFLCWQLLIVTPRASPSACYYATNYTVYESPDYVVPCGNGSATISRPQGCCDLSANNECMSDSLCYDPNSLGGVFYIASCTDPTYSASECPQYCGNRADKNQLDVIYDSNDKIWRCCSTNPNGDSNCSHPTDETFNAPPPQDLTVLYPASATNPAGSSPTLQLSSTSSISKPSETPQPSHTSISNGAIAGIVVGGVGASVILLASLGAYLHYRHRHQPRVTEPKRSGSTLLGQPSTTRRHGDSPYNPGDTAHHESVSGRASMATSAPASGTYPGFDRMPPYNQGADLNMK